jgi:hypothetical protein
MSIKELTNLKALLEKQIRGECFKVSKELSKYTKTVRYIK